MPVVTLLWCKNKMSESRDPSFEMVQSGNRETVVKSGQVSPIVDLTTHKNTKIFPTPPNFTQKSISEK